MSKILIVEDELSIAELEKDYLELSSFEVDIETDGKSGLERALAEDYDMIILDLMLPEMDGFEICKKIRAQKDIPILMVSAKKDDIDKIHGFGLGADDYITKPFSPSELVARVKAHLARYDRLVGSNAQENDIIEIRGIKIDKTARRVYVNGEEKAFTTKEFDLLTFLASNPNRVFKKEELFNKIWDMESIGDIATSKSIINNLARFFMININLIECKVCINVSASCRYLLHLDDKEKMQYDFDDLYTNDSQKFIDIINNADYEYTILNFNMLFEIVLSSNSLIEVYKRVGLSNAQKYRYVIKDMFEQRYKL